MSKNIKKVIALAIVMAVVVSAFSAIGMTSMADDAFTAKVTGWAGSNLSTAIYPWFAADKVTQAQQDATRDAAAAELEYQNNVLGFKMGIKDDGDKNDDGQYEWGISQGWGDAVIVEVENRKPELTDNVGSPWVDQPGRLWAAVVAPYPGMAFSIKGISAKAPNTSSGGTNIFVVGNEYVKDSISYQQFNTFYAKIESGAYSRVNRFPGAKNSSVDDTRGKFRHAYARYSQNNKDNYDGNTKLSGVIGVPLDGAAGWTKTVGSTLTQEFTGPAGNAYIIGIKPEADDMDYDSGAYVVSSDLYTAFNALGGADMAACLAVTGMPTGDTIGTGSAAIQSFENGTLSPSGFKSNTCEVLTFSVTGETKPAEIDNEHNTIIAYVPSTQSVTSVTPAITHNGASITPSGAQNFTSAVEYTVTAVDGTVKKYTVNIVKQLATDINQFVVAGVTADIDPVTKTITAIVPGGTNLSAVTPTITTVETGVTISPAGATNFTSSWTNGVKYTITKGSTTSEYTVKVRAKSMENDITSFKVPAKQLTYKFSDGRDIVGEISGTVISIDYPYGNIAAALVTPEIQISAGATLDSKLNIAESQTAKKYKVTSENGDVKEYTVTVNIDTSDTKIYRDPPDVRISYTTPRFDGKADRKLIEAVKAEYENQCLNYSFDPGEALGSIEAWDGSDILNAQKFTGGSGTVKPLGGGDADVTSLITADVPNGLAYTIKGEMFRHWASGITDEDQPPEQGHPTWLFSNAGSAAANAFVMDGVTYQQFALSFAWSSPTALSGGRPQSGIQTVGIGNARKAQYTDIEDSLWYDKDAGTFRSAVTYGFREGYERSNVLGYNPGVAFNPNVPYVSPGSPPKFTGRFTYIGGDNLSVIDGGQPIMTEETLIDEVTRTAQGMAITTTTKGKFENYILYQMFYGSGDISKPESASMPRNKTDRSALVKGADRYGIDNGGSLIITADTAYNQMQRMYESLNKAVTKPAAFKNKSFNYVNMKVGEEIDLGSGNKIAPINFSFNSDLGTPSNFFVNEAGDYLMTFTINEIVKGVNDTGASITVTDKATGEETIIVAGDEMDVIKGTRGYFKAPKGNLNRIEWFDGEIYSNNNKLNAAVISGAEVKVYNRGDVYPADKDLVKEEYEKGDMRPRTFSMNTIYINYSASAPFDITNVNFSAFQLDEPELALVTLPVRNETTGRYNPIDCSLTVGRVTVKAENEDLRSYNMYVYKDGVPQGDPFTVDSLKDIPWGFENEPQIVYPRRAEDGAWEYYDGYYPGNEANYLLMKQDADGTWITVWDEFYGYYEVEGDASTFKEVGNNRTGIPWKEEPALDVWIAYCRDHGIKR